MARRDRKRSLKTDVTFQTNCVGASIMSVIKTAREPKDSKGLYRYISMLKEHICDKHKTSFRIVYTVTTEISERVQLSLILDSGGQFSLENIHVNTLISSMGQDIYTRMPMPMMSLSFGDLSREHSDRSVVSKLGSSLKHLIDRHNMRNRIRATPYMTHPYINWLTTQLLEGDKTCEYHIINDYLYSLCNALRDNPIKDNMDVVPSGYRDEPGPFLPSFIYPWDE
jgi:hypothetical protein